MSIQFRSHSTQPPPPPTNLLTKFRFGFFKIFQRTFPIPSETTPPPEVKGEVGSPLLTSSSSSETSSQEVKPTDSPTLLERDQELMRKLLDMHGGSASVGIVDGQYEGGMGPETRKNMFRVI
ncbi:hypothetical protein IE53DRAFT_368714 [Violaceomyces palustris]|uniref:Uncharacterized protein n=1 Tax=Violaceomyces palustris TaxID=1673888 RepID=A0ACD0NY42_9BASI|nr:hypothetical protein IE53DRAFT_368714 [Violaceomyces palustris]